MDRTKPFTHAGYSVVDALRDSGRNAVYRLEKGTSSYIGKLNFTKESVKMENDVWWCLTMQRLTDEWSPVRAPKMYEYGDGWFIQEYIEAPLLSETDWPDRSHIVSQASTLVEVLSWLDRAITVHVAQAQYGGENSAPYDNIMQKVESWAAKPLQKGLVHESTISQARVLIERHKAAIMPALQHGDFVPWHVFDARPQVVLFDGEHASMGKPRYYDLAYLYTRLYTRADAADVARTILSDFIQKNVHDQKSFTSAFMPVLALRAIGMFHDAYNDLHKKDYVQQAQRLMEEVLSEDINVLAKT